VYDSLRAQTLRDFEWLVIDDGSTDGTSELIKQWIESADFPIRYFRQENSGKHIAHNLAVREARGQLFAPLDSDDAILSNALERICLHWNEIPISSRAYFAGIWGLCCDQHGKLIGDRYPASSFDADLREVHYVRHVRGEKSPVFRTEVLRQFPFPEVQKTYIPEGMIWLEIAKTYKTRFVNEVFRIYFVNDEMTEATITNTGARGSNARGRLDYYVWLLNGDLQYFAYSPTPFLKAAVMLPIVAWRSGHSFRSALTRLDTFRARALVCLALPFAVLLRTFDKTDA
jgi:glycosyltransferase involved in cell wall biosynthesis